MSNKERASYWRNQIEQWQTFGLSGAKFCQDNGIHLKRFYYWHRKCSRKTIQSRQNKTPLAGFANIVVADTQRGDPGLCFTLANGSVISGITSANVALVGALLAQL